MAFHPSMLPTNFDSPESSGPVVWDAVDNEIKYNLLTAKQESHPEEIDARLEVLSYSGDFLADYVDVCWVLGLIPHPSLVRHDHPVMQRIKPDLTMDKKELKKRREKANPGVRAKTPSDPADMDEGKDGSAEELRINGWHLDIGTTFALEKSLLSTKQITSVHCWDAEASIDTIESLAMAIHNSGVQKLSLDFNAINHKRAGEMRRKVADALKADKERRKRLRQLEERKKKEEEDARLREEEEKKARDNDDPASPTKPKKLKRVPSKASAKKKAAEKRPKAKAKGGKEAKKDPVTSSQQLRTMFKPFGKTPEEVDAEFMDRNPWPSLLPPTGSCLQVLSLRANKLDDTVACSLFESLKENKLLLSLNLWGNCITDESVPVLFDCLMYNKTLVSLSLGKNKLTTEGSKQLALAFCCETLDKDEAKAKKKLGWSVTSTKTKTFRDANCYLRALNLSDNAIEDAGVAPWLFNVNIEAGSRPPLTEEEREKQSASGIKMTAKMLAREPHGKANRLEWVCLQNNLFSPELHRELHAEAKVLVQPLPLSSDAEQENNSADDTSVDGNAEASEGDSASAPSSSSSSTESKDNTAARADEVQPDPSHDTLYD
jgi:hypothetical protein